MLAGERRYLPLELQHQIDDHQQAIKLVKRAMAGELSEAELREALRSFLIKVNFNEKDP